jgi:hypothetical protein
MEISRDKKKRIENWGKTFEFFGARKCMICEIESDMPIYELHHHDQEGKETNISSIMHHSWAKVEKELRKCILVCSNCHRILHHVARERRK